MRYQITSDSTCDLSPQQLEQYHIKLIPLYVQMGGKSYRDGVSVTPDEIYNHVAAGGNLASTAALNPEDYREVFAEASARCDFVLHICISFDFSSCYQNACLAAQEFDNVYVVDSRNLSTGHGLVVLEAVRMAESGMAPEKIVGQLNELTARVDASFILDRLDYMKKGGRCSSVEVLGANLLKQLHAVAVGTLPDFLAHDELAQVYLAGEAGLFDLLLQVVEFISIQANDNGMVSFSQRSTPLLFSFVGFWGLGSASI